MKTLNATLLIILLLAPLGCRRQPQGQPQDTKTQMMLDSDVSGKNVTIVRPKEAVHPTESVADLKELPTTMQYDIDAPGRVPSKEIVYMKTGEAARPSENKR